MAFLPLVMHTNLPPLKLAIMVRNETMTVEDEEVGKRGVVVVCHTNINLIFLKYCLFL